MSVYLPLDAQMKWESVELARIEILEVEVCKTWYSTSEAKSMIELAKAKASNIGIISTQNDKIIVVLTELKKMILAGEPLSAITTWLLHNDLFWPPTPKTSLLEQCIQLKSLATRRQAMKIK